MAFFIFDVETSMTNQQFVETLKSSVAHSAWVIPRRSLSPFFGTVSYNGFQISRTIKGRNSFRPILFGRFLDETQSTRVRVIMTFHPIVWLFIAAWPLFIANDFLTNLEIQGYGDGIILRILIFFWPLIIGVPVFFFEAIKSKKLLFQILGLNFV